MGQHAPTVTMHACTHLCAAAALTAVFLIRLCIHYYYALQLARTTPSLVLCSPNLLATSCFPPHVRTRSHSSRTRWCRSLVSALMVKDHIYVHIHASAYLYQSRHILTRHILDCEQSNVLLAHLLHTDRRQDLGDNVSRDIANFSSNFVAMATTLGRGKI